MIVSVMPDLSEETVMTVTDKLLELGVKVQSDMKFVEAKELTPPLTTVEARKLIFVLTSSKYMPSLP
jgi:hypothetical protein